MAKVRKRRLWVDDPEAVQGVKTTRWYYADPNEDLAALIDAAEDQADLPPFFETSSAAGVEPDLTLGEVDTQLTEGRYQFMATHLDEAGNESDPYQHPAWADVVIDVVPPDPPTGGGIEIV